MSDHAIPLREDQAAADPLRQFEAWLADAQASTVRETGAAALATASADGSPSVRMVLVKSFDQQGFVFYSNYASRKGHELALNPRAALLFHWDPLGRQVRIEGPVERTSAEQTAEHVRARPRASQLSALASPQSETLESREQLEEEVATLATRYAGEELPIPDAWGGFRLVPESFEFWQQRNDRLHDRLSYRRENERWVIERLAP
jgi:pyridoxamine 5'-phosphate oxidase